MEANDYWTHVGLAVGFLITVVAPRMFNGDYAEFTTIYLIGAAVLVGVATILRLRSRAAERAANAQPTPAES